MTKLLAPGETRTKTLADGTTVRMGWTMNGSYVQVTHRDADRTIRFNRNYMHDFDAVRKYDELAAEIWTCDEDGEEFATEVALQQHENEHHDNA